MTDSNRAGGRLSLNRIRTVMPDRWFFVLNAYRYRYSLEPEVQFLSEMVRPDSVALDVGCAWGSFSYWLAKVARRAIAFEPNPELSDYLRRVLPANVELRTVAVSNTAGPASLLVPRAGSDPFALASLDEGNPATRGAEPVEVSTVRLDDLDLADVSFVKIDVEGFEERVLDGAARLLETVRPNVFIEVEERHNPGSVRRVAERLTAGGYQGWFRYDGAWLPIARFDIAEHQDAERVSVKSGKYVNNFYYSTGRASFLG